MSIDMPRLPNKPQMGNPLGLPQHFAPQGIQVQQHNIMGQAFIELCHRAPEGRPRLPFNSSSATALSTVPQHQQPRFLPRPDCQGLRQLEPARHNPQSLNNPLHVSTSLEHLPPNQQGPVNPSPVLVMCPLNHPPVNEAFSGAPLPASASAETARGLQIPAQHTGGLEEKLDPDDPAVKDLDVKDLEGVEVKDLVDEDLENLNLDTEDGKGDELDTLDNLETNDRHLDDLLRSGEFDIIAYTDPELDLGDKKSMFNEELDLSVPIDDIQGKADDAQQKPPGNKATDAADLLAVQKQPVEVTEIKTEVLSPDALEETIPESSDGNVPSSGTPLSAETELLDGEKKSTALCTVELPDKASADEETTGSNPGAVQGPAPPPAQSTASPCNISGSTPVLTSLLANESSENPDVRPLNSPPLSLPAAQTNPASSIPQTLMTPAGQTMENALPPNVNLVPPISHNFPPGTAVNPGFISGQPVNHNLETGHPGNQTVPIVNRPGPSGMPSSQQMMLPPTLGQPQNRERPLLLEEQPLLLQDLLDQERQEQQQQRQMQAMIRQRSEPFFPNIGMFFLWRSL